ncbi:hypothetical protein CTAYLR_008919 [Chrysophaeum taylorii]|uniref:Uncharacterized protein n=1 Tax=Chrysophaeum taylorii TaxID=2483200 RepID=A0AAD7UB40_9STRA|nr:hypothetical protein CTAYLR_008919 [Chrysophaeum taylorii]
MWRAAMMLIVCGGSNTTVVRLQPSTLGPQCADMMCMPDPRVSAYFAPWREGSAVDLWQRWGNGSLMMRRRLAAAEETLAAGGYYARAINQVATLSGPGIWLERRRVVVSAPTTRKVVLEFKKRKGGVEKVPVVAERRREECQDRHAFVLPGFFYLPHNLFHLFADNLLPLASSIAGAPGCNASTLRCEPPATLVTREKRLVSTPGAAGALGWLFEVVDAIFDGRVSDWNEGCATRLTWGKGRSVAYADETSGAEIQALRDLLDRRFGAKNGDSIPTAVHVERFKRKPRDLRFVAPSAAKKLETAFLAQHMRHRTCCNFTLQSKNKVGDMWRLLRDADVLYMLHGAGQVNALFARPKAVLVQLYGAKGWESVTCRRFASAVGGGYVRAPLALGSEPGHVLLSPDQAAVVARCAVVVWRAGFFDDPDDAERVVHRACFQARHRTTGLFYVTEAWSAHHNRILKPPPRRAGYPRALGEGPPVASSRNRRRLRGRVQLRRRRHNKSRRGNNASS